MTTSRRSFLLGAGATALLTAFGGAAAMAQSAAPTVTEQDAKNLFVAVASDKIWAMTNYRNNFDINSDIRTRYNQVQTDHDRALIVAFMAMGGPGQVDAACNEAYNSYARPADSEGDFIPVSSTAGVGQVFNKYAMATMNYGGKNMGFVQEIASSANDLLWSAYEGQHKTGNLNSFLQGYVIQHPENTVFSLIRQGALALGLRSSNTTIAALRLNH